MSCEVPASELDATTLAYLRRRVVKAVSADYTATCTDDIIEATAPVTVTLPAAADSTGCQILVKRFTAAGDVTVAAQPGEKIDYDDERTFNLDTWAEAYVSDGTKWVIIT
ncbi:hypothetical protein [Litorivivens sp.]|uniref:hypothetical protein n=1 Tax=Litorivivens sp. TaxID=2020868 RepID=UPI003564C9E6